MKEYSDYLVQRVNELYHDLLGKDYEDSHPEIFKRLPPRWQRLAPLHFQSSKSLTILDLGTGTGFVPLQVAAYLKKGDTFICSDISSTILQVAKENIKENTGTRQFHNKFKYVKVTAKIPYTLPFKDASMDIVTVNSMLHHIKDTQSFLQEIDRILKPGGKVIIAHEPLALFQKHFFLSNQARLWQLFLCPRQTITRMARMVGLLPILEKAYYTFRKPKVNNRELAEKISGRLMSEGVLTGPIAPSELKRITDIQIQGFAPEKILPDYELVHLETYNHLSDDVAKKYNNRFILAYEGFLEKRFPKAGNQFLLIKQKQANVRPKGMKAVPTNTVNTVGVNTP